MRCSPIKSSALPLSSSHTTRRTTVRWPGLLSEEDFCSVYEKVRGSKLNAHTCSCARTSATRQGAWQASVPLRVCSPTSGCRSRSGRQPTSTCRLQPPGTRRPAQVNKCKMSGKRKTLLEQRRDLVRAKQVHFREVAALHHADFELGSLHQSVLWHAAVDLWPGPGPAGVQQPHTTCSSQ